MGRALKIASWVVAAACWVAPAASLANPYDISLRGLGRPAPGASLSDPAVLRYHALSSELALALAPRPLAPAETLGLSGFEFSFVNTLADINAAQPYWQGQPGEPILEGVLPAHGGRSVPSTLWIPSAHLRKGLPMSTEIGINSAYLAYSDMFFVGGEAKMALYESYFRYVPALTMRTAFGRLFGSTDLDMFTFEADGITSMAFGVGGMAQLTPYLGYGVMFAHVNSQVIDETPYEVRNSSDQKGGADGSLYTFPTLEWNKNQHTRIFGGLRISVAMLELLYEFDLGQVKFNKKQLLSHSFKIGFDI
jgi:hypothetical protein